MIHYGIKIKMVILYMILIIILNIIMIILNVIIFNHQEKKLMEIYIIILFLKFLEQKFQKLYIKGKNRLVEHAHFGQYFIIYNILHLNRMKLN